MTRQTSCGLSLLLLCLKLYSLRFSSQESRFRGRHKQDDKDLKGKRVCNACQRKREKAAFAVNQTVCDECKKALDVMARSAKLQNEQEWWKCLRADPQRMKAALDNFRRNKQEASESGKKRAHWSVARAKQALYHCSLLKT